jgi:hypothetical protein
MNVYDDETETTRWKKTKPTKKKGKLDAQPSNFMTSPLDTIPVVPHQETPPEDLYMTVENFNINNPPDMSALLDGDGDYFSFLSTYFNKALNLLLYPVTSFHAGVHKAAYLIGMTFSNGNMSQQDEDCIYDFFSTLIAFIVTIMVFYNWFFILYFSKTDLSKPLPDVSWSGLCEKSSILGLIFKYLVCQVSLVNAIAMKIRDLASKMSAQLLFLVLFVVLFYYVSTRGDYVMNLLQTAINQQLDDSMNNAFIGYAFLFAAYSMAQEAAQDPASFITKFTSIVMVIGTFILFIIRILVSISVMWIAALFIALYLILYSFFGIPLFSKYGIFETISKINQFLVKDYLPPDPDKYSKCRPRTWMEFFVETSKWILNSVYRYFFEYVLIIYLLNAIATFQNTLGDNQNLRDAMTYFTILLIIGVCGFIYSKIFPKIVMANPKVVKEVEVALGVTEAVPTAPVISEGGVDVDNQPIDPVVAMHPPATTVNQPVNPVVAMHPPATTVNQPVNPVVAMQPSQPSPMVMHQPHPPMNQPGMRPPPPPPQRNNNPSYTFGDDIDDLIDADY